MNDMAAATIGPAEGLAMHALATELFPICRSITGDGVRQTFDILKRYCPNLETFSIKSGEQALDWKIPDEWNIRSAKLIGPSGEVIADFADNNLHVVGYSEPVDKELTLEELQPHLHSIPDQPDAIPYVTSYYRRYWGFCIPHSKRANLQPGSYRAVIDSTLAPGELIYGEAKIAGESEEEIFVSTYICHPSMANNELSGPMVTTWLARWIASAPRRYSYRIVFVPETIGSIAYISRNLAEMKQRIIAGFNVTCIGDERVYSYLPSRHGDTLADRAAKHVLGHIDPNYIRYRYLDRGSDERQYCSPGVDLPVASVMRSKYGRYPEYHTSLDDLTLVTPTGLQGGLDALRRCVECVEGNRRYQIGVLGEPQLGPRGLYPTMSTKGSAAGVRSMMNFIAYADGTRDLLEIADLIGAPAWDIFEFASKLVSHGLMKTVD
jgi:aminopeptidase-like protein